MTSAATGLLTEKPRISSIDLMRGIVMVIMALDHTRDFFHVYAFQFDPEDLTRTTPAIFFTRWITHFCAPTFVLLAGTGIRLSQQRKSKKELSQFLLTRGLWLVFLEFTVVRFSFFYNLYYDFTIVQVIYTIGSSMIIFAALIYVKESYLLLLGIIITLGHNALDAVQLHPGDPFFQFWIFFSQNGADVIAPGKLFMVKYPTLPWLGIMLMGYSLGSWYVKGFDAARRQKLLLYTGIGVTALFIVLRLINGYGDPSPWSPQQSLVFSVISFLNCTKYPVSLMYTLMTLGPVLIILWAMEKIPVIRFKPIEVFGKVPMFYYLLHFYLIHTLSIVTYLVVRHKSFSELDFHFGSSFGGVPITAGYSLGWVYVVWVTVVLICYPLCKKYNDYKSTHHQWWLSYL